MLRGSALDYLEYYKLNQEPFSNAPVSRFYFDSSQHSQALVRLMFAMSAMKGLALLVGDIGAGKTTLARRLLDALDEREYEAALLVIIHRDVTSDWLLRRIAIQLGVERPDQDKLMLLSQLYRRLVEIYESGKKAVVLIDEAQMLDTRELMEEFRGLLNLEVPERKLLSFVFFGLPEIENNLRKDPPLAQRVALRVRLDPLDLPSTDAYVRHRLRMAGATRPIFDDDAIAVIHRAAGGVPRLINTVCDNALLEGMLGRLEIIGGDLVRPVAANLGLSPDGVSGPTVDDFSTDVPTAIPGPPISGGPVPAAPISGGPMDTDIRPRSALPYSASTEVALDEIDKVLAALSKQ